MYINTIADNIPFCYKTLVYCKYFIYMYIPYHWVSTCDLCIILEIIDPHENKNIIKYDPYTKL